VQIWGKDGVRQAVEAAVVVAAIIEAAAPDTVASAAVVPAVTRKESVCTSVTYLLAALSQIYARRSRYMGVLLKFGKRTVLPALLSLFSSTRMKLTKPFVASMPSKYLLW